MLSRLDSPTGTTSLSTGTLGDGIPPATSSLYCSISLLASGDSFSSLSDDLIGLKSASDDEEVPGAGPCCKLLLSLMDPRLVVELLPGATLATEKDLDLGMVSETVVGELGLGLLLREPVGDEPGVLSREWRKLELRVRQGSVSRVGRPVAEVVVVHVLVDMRRIRLGGRLRRSRCGEQCQGLNIVQEQCEVFCISNKNKSLINNPIIESTLSMH